jgi:hypothetical protein
MVGLRDAIAVIERHQALVSVGVLAAWTAFVYLNDFTYKSNSDATARLIEARAPFLQRRTETYLAITDVTGKMVASIPSGKDDASWNELMKRFWALRWAEAEMIGGPEVRERMRAVGYAATLVSERAEELRLSGKSLTVDDPKAHYLRWMVECLADTLRVSMERSWNTADLGGGLPNGCEAGRRDKIDPPYNPDANMPVSQ